MNQQFSYKYITCKSALNHIHSRFLPYHWDLNVYRGCKHQCAYCFAQYSHHYLEDKDFFHHIYIKENIIEQLENKLKSNKWNREVINLGGVTDSYQEIEKTEGKMPQILSLLIQYHTPAIICTKSSLILRDIALLKKLSDVAGLQVSCTITTLDQNLANVLEPNASSIKERVNMIKELKKEGLTVGWHLMPMIPYITATRNNLTAIFKTASACKIDYMIAEMLNLKGGTKRNFFQFIQKNYPSYYEPLWQLYHNKEKRLAYKKELYNIINELSKTYHISRNYLKYVPKERKEIQLSVFDFITK